MINFSLNWQNNPINIQTYNKILQQSIITKFIYKFYNNEELIQIQLSQLNPNCKQANQQHLNTFSYPNQNALSFIRRSKKQCQLIYVQYEILRIQFKLQGKFGEQILTLNKFKLVQQRNIILKQNQTFDTLKLENQSILQNQKNFGFNNHILRFYYYINQKK
ncbi:unnamed protein product [Paramecium pentaurelia]|uniref:Uncharacterized protein n=1 Tax=Paramecium pentaurelia TaxID=43138 RepID=A0A8S1SB25_9CILI|nr:unnamed protein product [Paramecium pentaurelia]